MQSKKVCKAFANEQRLKLLLCLSRPKSVSELLTYCPLSQSALSQHLRVLRDLQIVQTQRRGKQVVYSVKDKRAITIAKLLLNF